MGLEEYREKRDFRRTAEPSPQPEPGEGPLLFVVQKHRARQLHYDFRLELNGALKSWSVPKGPSLDPETKRLAVMVEDHPLDYASFEGAIPKGQYGSGEVIVWDYGTYSPDEGGRLLFTDRPAAEEQMRRGLEAGKLSFSLRGRKLKGSWTLVRTRKSERDWLLIKHRDDYASPDADILEDERSVLSERTIEDVRAGRTPQVSLAALLDPKRVDGARPARFPSAGTPMLASLAEGPFSGPDWIFEPKLDGYRVIAHIREGDVILLSRRGVNITRQYSALVPDLSLQPASELVLDGEIIAVDEEGRQCFQCLQQYLSSLGQIQAGQAGPPPLVYYVFDILHLDGYDLRGATLRSRKGLLHGVLRPTNRVRLMDYFERDGETVYRAAVENGLEGVIAKQVESTYESGRRSRNWLKVKAVLSDEFVIGGFSVAEKGRARTFSSLLLGYFDDKGKLVFAGHVGSGFDEAMLNELKHRLDAIRVDECPFSEAPPLNAPTTWVRPELVAEVKFSEWTRDGRLRIPVFVRLREDKPPAEVGRGEAVAVPAVRQSASDVVQGVLQQLRNGKESLTLELEGNRIKLSNLNKVLWPSTNAHADLTKREFLEYLATVSLYILPHLKDRPLTMTRYPDGVYGKHFYQKQWSHAIPEFVQTVNVRGEAGARHEYPVCNNLSTLLWLGQLANIEFHTWFSRVSAGPDMPEGQADTDHALDSPDFIIFDLDPYIYGGKEQSGDEPELNREGFVRTAEVALWLKEVLDELSVNAFVKTSGKTGLHIYVPVVRRLNYKAVRSVAEMVGRFLLRRHPREITMEWAVEKRAGKVFLDYGQNVRGKTLASAYSPRPTSEATVSTPLRWEELEKVYPTDFSLLSLPGRLEEIGDLWAEMLSARRDLSKLLEPE